MSFSQSLNTHNQAIELVERFAKYILGDCKSKDEMSTVKNLAPYITRFSRAIELNNAREEIFQKFVDKIDSAVEELDAKSVLKEFHEEINETTKLLKNKRDCEKYNEFMELISQYNDSDSGEDIETVSQNINTVDPISKKPIVEPVKNRICGHIYEKQIILQFINQNPRTKCPIPGCNASDCVRKNDLVPESSGKRILTSHSSGNSQKKLKT